MDKKASATVCVYKFAKNRATRQLACTVAKKGVTVYQLICEQ